MNDNCHISACQRHFCGKASHDFRKVIALLAVHFSKNCAHVVLRGNDNPCTAPTPGGETLCNGLQVGHQLDVFGDILAYLVYKEVKTEVSGLLIDIGIDLIGKILYRDSVLASVFIKNTDCYGVSFSCSLAIRFGNIP